MAAAGAGDSEKSGFRWLDLARYAVAAVVTVVIIAVVVKAIKVVFRPDSLTLSVLGGSVYTTVPPPPAREPSLSFSFSLRARNPSGRVHMYCLNITVYLFNSSTPATMPEPMADCLVFFNLKDMSVMQMEYLDIIKQATVERDPGVIQPFAFDVLHETGGSIKDVTMRVEGMLVTEIRSGYNTTPRAVKYYCRQLVVGLHDVATMNTQETSCSTS